MARPRLRVVAGALTVLSVLRRTPTIIGSPFASMRMDRRTFRSRAKNQRGRRDGPHHVPRFGRGMGDTDPNASSSNSISRLAVPLSITQLMRLAGDGNSVRAARPSANTPPSMSCSGRPAPVTEIRTGGVLIDTTWATEAQVEYLLKTLRASALPHPSANPRFGLGSFPAFCLACIRCAGLQSPENEDRCFRLASVIAEHVANSLTPSLGKISPPSARGDV